MYINIFKKKIYKKMYIYRYTKESINNNKNVNISKKTTTR